jgi:hypothetical protein
LYGFALVPVLLSLPVALFAYLVHAGAAVSSLWAWKITTHAAQPEGAASFSVKVAFWAPEAVEVTSSSALVPFVPLNCVLSVALMPLLEPAAR